MLISLNTRTIETQGVQSSQRASIAMGAKFVRVFASQIYSDKPLAIIGELLANAWDSHRLAGKDDVPIQLKLPTTFDRKLRIYDSGVGMSHEFMMTRFNCFLDSTKDNENFSAGGYGIGSKTPAAYTDSYTIRCRQNGKARTYIEYKDTDGVLNLAYVGEEQTDESDGVDVTIEIKPEDISRFVAAARFAVPFVTKPNVEVFGAEFTGSPWQHQNADLSLFKKSWFPSNYQHSHLAVVGPRAYKMDLYAHGIECPEALHRMEGVAFHFDIGEVEITPSREALSLTKETIEAVNRKIQQFIVSYKEYLTDALNACPDFLSAFHFWQARVNDYYTRQMFKELAITWRGVDFLHDIDLSEPAHRFSMGGYKRKINWSNHPETHNPNWVWMMQNSSELPLIIVKDSSVAWQVRLRAVIKATSTSRNVLLVSSVADAQALLSYAQLPLDQYELLSSFRQQPTTQKAMAQRRPVPTRIYLPGTNDWEDLKDIWSYMQNSSRTLYATGLLRGKFPTEHDKQDFMLKYFSQDLPDAVVIGVQQSQAALLRKLKLPDFAAYIRAKQAKLACRDEYEQTMMTIHYDWPPSNELKSYGALLQKNRYLSKETRRHLHTVLAQIEKNESALGSLHQFHSYAKDILGFDVEIPGKTDYVRSWEWLKQSFPLLTKLFDAAPYYMEKSAAHEMIRYMVTQEALHGCLHQD